jgi:chromosome segregation ATPase
MSEIVSFPQSPEKRLKAALGSLAMALQDQASAVAEWRDQLSRLKSEVSGVGASLNSYDAALDDLASGVALLRGNSLTLETIAERASQCAK